MKHQGFTIIELVVVVVLISIVGLYASSKFIGINSFSAAVAQEQAIAIIRQIQLNSMQANFRPNDSLDLNAVCRQLVVTSEQLGRPQNCDQRQLTTDKLHSDQVAGASFMAVNFPSSLANPTLFFDFFGRHRLFDGAGHAGTQPNAKRQ